MAANQPVDIKSGHLRRVVGVANGEWHMASGEW